MKPLLPQAEPIMMVDDVVVSDCQHASTMLHLTADKYLDAEAALVEFAAQSCAALIDFRQKDAKIGYIGEVRNFQVTRIPAVGETLSCELEIIAEMAGVSLVQVQISAGAELLAQGRLKLFVNE